MSFGRNSFGVSPFGDPENTGGGDPPEPIVYKQRMALLGVGFCLALFLSIAINQFQKLTEYFLDG